MIRIREITDAPALREAYARGFDRFGAHPLDRDYLARCRTFAWVDGDGRMVGGFVLNDQAPFRSTGGIGAAEEQRILARLDLSQTVECAGLWLLPEMRRTTRGAWCWLLLLAHLRRVPRRDLLLVTYAEGLRRLYMQMHAEMLSQGVIERDGRVMPRYVMRVSGKRGFLNIVVRESARRIGAWARATLVRGVQHLQIAREHV